MTSVLQPSFAAGELSPSLHGRVDLGKYHVGADTLLNFIVHPHGGASNRPGTIYVGDAGQLCRLIPFEFSVEQAYVLEFSELRMRIIKDGGYVVYPSGPDTGEIVEIVSPYAYADLALLKFTQSFDTMFLTHPDYAPQSLTRADHHDWTFATLAFDPTVASPTALAATPAASAGDTYHYKVVAATALDVEGTYSAVRDVTVPNPFAGSVVITWAAVVGADHYNVYRAKNAGAYVLQAQVSATNYTDVDGGPSGATPTGGGGLAAPATISATFVPGAGARDYRYEVAAVVGGLESLPSAEAIGSVADPWPAGTNIVLTWTPVSGATSYEVYKNSRGMWGWLGSTTEASFLDDNVDPDITFGPRTAAEYDFTDSLKHPGSVSLFQQRLVFARTDTDPQTIFTSKTGSFLDFSISIPVRDDDPITAKPASGRADEIRHMVAQNGLIIFTAGTEWLMTGNDAGLSPTSVQFSIQSSFGCSHVPPIVAGKSVLFVQRNGKQIRDLFFDFQFDGYSGNDMSVLAQHLFKDSTIKEWAYQQAPNGIIWCVMEDGSVRGFTYLKEHQVYAWHRHDFSGGLVRSVACIPGATQDDVYFLIERTIDGATVWYVEQLAPRVADGGVFCDASITQTYGTPTTAIAGLDHLEGAVVSVLADKNVENHTVVAGAITLQHTASTVIVGLPYVSDLKTLDLAVQGGEPSQGKRQKVSRVLVRFEDTRGAFVGPDFDEDDNGNPTHLYEIPWRSFEGYNEPTMLHTAAEPISISASWTRKAQVCVRQTYPLPITILGLIPEIDVGD